MEKRELDSCGEERNGQLLRREKWTVVGKREMDTHEERNKVVEKREMDSCGEERNGQLWRREK